MSSHPVLRATQKWIDEVVVGLGFCPFASASIKAGGLRLELCATTEVEDLCRLLVDELVFLQSQKGETYDSTLLVHPNLLSDFAVFNEFLGMCEDILAGLSLEGVFQIASFHPRYCFADADENDVGNYTNRSPYPMLHILREASIEAALKTYPDPQNIPTRNIKLTQDLGLQVMKALLEACYK